MDSIGVVNEHKEPQEVNGVSSNSAIDMNHLDDSNDDKSVVQMSSNERNVNDRNFAKSVSEEMDCDRPDAKVSVENYNLM